MNYWLIIQGEKIGPVSLEQLKTEYNIRPDTLVWHEGMPAWAQARTLPELAGLFPSPAAFSRRFDGDIVIGSSAPRRDAIPPKPATYLGWSIAAIICCCFIPAIVSLVYATQVSSRYDNGDYAGAQKASDMAEIWLIVSIVAGLVWAPFGLLLML